MKKQKFISGLLSCNDSAKIAQLENIAKKLFKRLNLPENCTYLPKYYLEQNNPVKCLKKGKFKIIYQLSNIFSNKIYFTIIKN